MDTYLIWEWLEALSERFYDPTFFWAVPMLVALAHEAAKRLRRSP